MFLILAPCLLAYFAVPNLGQEKTDEAAIRALELKWADAYKQRQIAKLASLLADDYVITTEDGNVYSKIGFVSQNAGQLRVDAAEKGEAGGKPYDYHDRLTDVWMKIGGKWLLIASHYSVPTSS